MELKLEGFGYDNTEKYKISLELRSLIFVQELGFDKHLEFDGKDFKAMHYLLFRDHIPVGVARWTQKGDEIYVDRFGILYEFRKRGFGLVFIKFILEDLIPSKKKILLFSTKENITFFTHFGFYETNRVEQVGVKEYHILNFN